MKIIRQIIGFLFGGTVFLVLIPAALYFVSTLLDKSLGLPTFGDAPARLFVFWPLLLVGLLFVLWSNLFLVIRGKGGPAEGFGVAVSPPTEKLVVTGPYRYTRNPMVFGAQCCYMGFMVWLGSIAGIVIVACFVVFAVFYLKNSEEKRLVKDFGKDYEEYRKRVPLLVPWFRKGK
jgi:protein-S-isoprenylcysteine O-methyltransferase Ste14